MSMKNKIILVLTSALKEIKSDATIYLDSVMQSDKEFYFILSLEHGGADNVGINIQNKAWLVDIALVDNVSNNESKKMVDALIEQCEAFFNVLEIDGNQIFPENYQAYSSDGVQHVSFTVAFPQYIEWSELNGN